MPRDIPVGNGNLLVAFDQEYRLREFYFPHVGEENHTKNEPFLFGVWVNGRFSWVPSGWKIRKKYLDDSLVTNVEMINPELEIRIDVNDAVDFQENVYIKKIAVKNISKAEMDVRLFFHHGFHISGNSIGDTAAFRPEINALLHYKAERYFLINVYANKKFGIDHFATGNKEHQKKLEGTWKDAEDGELSGNPIAQGSVDSVAAVHLRLAPKETETCYYWICAGKNWNEVKDLNSYVTKMRPETLLKRTYDYWKLWVDKEGLNYSLLPEKSVELYKKSLLIMRTQIDNDGAIIAANDSDAVQFNRDTYSYMWPRDGALAAYALDMAGYPEITCRFFKLCSEIIEKDGYFAHKYTPTGVMASSWHPWQKDNKPQLPIQEDETALVVWALWKHFLIYKDIEFIRTLYKPLIKRAADFLMNFRDMDTRLPLPSYDLWEEKQGIFTFTAAAVHGGLIAASNFADCFGDTELSEEYAKGAEELKIAMDKYLYSEKEGRFAKMINIRRGPEIEADMSIDASVTGIFSFGAYDASDEKVRSTMKQVYDKLWCDTPVGGMARYENDDYYRSKSESNGNPWFITTLWLAQYYIATAKSRKDLAKAAAIMDWTAGHAMPSLVLAEQIDPFTHLPLSVSPLTWSHATFVATAQEYLNKLIKIEKCPTCGQAKYLKTR